MHNSRWINFHSQSCVFLYSFCASLLYSLIMWLIVSSLSSHNQPLLLLSFLLLLLNFQFYIQFHTIVHRLFTQDLGKLKVIITCILCTYVFSLPLLRNIFQSHCYYSSEERSSSAKCNFFHFLWAGTALYLVNVFICPSLD